MVFEELREAISTQLDIAPEKITMEASLVDDLKADSLDVVELIMDLEQKYNIQIPDEKLAELTTIASIVNYIEAHQ